MTATWHFERQINGEFTVVCGAVAPCRVLATVLVTLSKRDADGTALLGEADPVLVVPLCSLHYMYFSYNHLVGYLDKVV